jgi:hypothetical protein
MLVKFKVLYFLLIKYSTPLRANYLHWYKPLIPIPVAARCKS